MGIDCSLYNTNTNIELLKQHYNIPDNINTILFMGRLTKIKGLHLVIKALKNTENTLLLVAGNGNDLEYYKNLAEKYNINAKFLGFISGSNKHDLLNMVDLFVLPSCKLDNKRSEGTPVVLLEAMASGKIIIASNTGGISNIIKHNSNGLLFESENINNLSQLIKEVFQNKHFYCKLANKARISAQKYNINAIGERYLNIIKQVSSL